MPETSEVEAAITAVRRLPARAAFAREMRRITRAEIHASTALAGSQLTAEEVDALLDRDRAVGNHHFTDYVLVRAYADAAAWAAAMRSYPSGERRPLLTVDELRALNTRATRGSSSHGGAWRLGNPSPVAGLVAPAAWLVAREATTLLDRFGRGPQADPIAIWVARFFGRFARLLPFADANGRTARLAVNFMLRRLDIVPIVLTRRDRTRFVAARGAAATNNPAPLAAIIAAAIVRTSNGLSAAGTAAADALAPLREIAADDYTALAKAAQRGRLRTIVRGGRYFTTPEWVAEYRSTRPIRPARSPVTLAP